MILGGRTLSAEAAVELGLAMGIADDPDQAAFALASELAGRDPEALQLAKQIIDRGEEDASLEAERSAQATLYQRRES
jgi:enoyl-CoA hydratase/carnithine racemase